MVPSRRHLVIKLGLCMSFQHFFQLFNSVGHGLIGGLLACLIRGCMVGILYKDRPDSMWGDVQLNSSVHFNGLNFVPPGFSQLPL